MDADVEILQLRNEIFERLADFEKTVLVRFGSQDTELAEIKEHTKATNGSVARIDAAQIKAQAQIEFVAKHGPSTCPLSDRVAALEMAKTERIARESERDKAGKKMDGILRPIVIGAGKLILLVLALLVIGHTGLFERVLGIQPK